MSKLIEGTKVKTTTDLVGTVEAIYDMGSVVYYIVKLEDGSLYKFFEDQLTEIEEEPEKAPEEFRPVPDDDTEVVVTYGRLRDLIAKTAIEMSPNDPAKGFAYIGFGAVVACKLFSGRENV